jgi:hypothetical protein
MSAGCCRQTVESCFPAFFVLIATHENKTARMLLDEEDQMIVYPVAA